MINYLFIFLFIIGLFYGMITGRVNLISSALLETPKESLLIFFNIASMLIFWSGILEITVDSGMINYLTKYVKVLIRPIFREIPKDSLALDYIAMNFVANIIGVGSAATPFGLKAMDELNKLNNKSEIASKSMISLIVINTSGLCIIPSTIIMLRESYNSSNSTIVIPYLVCVTILTTIFAVILNEVCKHVF